MITLSPTEDALVNEYLGHEELTKNRLAKKMHRAPSTIQRHFQNIYEKTHVHNERGLMHWYFENVKNVNLKNLLL